MEQTIIVAAVLIAVVAIGAWLAWRRWQSASRARRYGTEYERLVRETGDVKKAERELEAREQRVRKFELRSIPAAERDRYWSEWERVQALFVEQPLDAVYEAHALLMSVMRDRGYPDASLEQRQKDLSVHYPNLVQPYREACDIASRDRSASAVTTEDLRRATIHYRSLFTALLEERSAPKRQKYEAAS